MTNAKTDIEIDEENPESERKLMDIKVKVNIQTEDDDVGEENMYEDM
eukprot:CAMPEP_0176363892 /NCGR_PEP_ID=MMETSP0126-20121128/19427_1 /TAXON_ID=141414 ORGANISM="Strombidinopsis acuminatum, Strain SPMC142" /NCGR_SAMPLE_ID=MMETSP0126 /ASSEMBLY_ACC=CAM_ASM_000229 /LENGTH=46 /DNA_ID= /DNA_START= /DNA_END= /DNA_ORIENTATION=